MTTLVEALNASCKYNGRNYNPGERFEIEDTQHVKMFVGWGKVKVVSETASPEPQRPPTYETAAEKAETEDTPADRKKRRERVYKRRDMRPEE